MDKMNEEEIIERANHFVNIHVLYGKTYGMTCDDLKEYQHVFRGLLDLYNKEKEKNKKLDSEIIRIRATLNEVTKDYVSKDKIREKIEEIKAKKDFPEFADYEWSDTEKILFHQADILEDLLEEE